MRIIKKIKNHFLEVIKLKTSPQEISLGFAIGTFIEIMSPIPGMDFIVAFVVISLFPKVSKISLLAAVLLLNSFITWPLYGLSYKIGDLLYGSSPVIKYNFEILNNVYNFSRRFFIGNFIVSTLSAVVSYIVTYLIVFLYKRKNNIK